MKIIKLPFKVKRQVLACGADVKGAFAIAKADKAYLFDGFADLSDPDNLTKYEKAVKSAIKALKIHPAVIACDLHPGYFSTSFAKDYTLSAKRYTLYKVQHHEAHVASCIVDNGIRGEVFAAAFDGTGYGPDKTIWGGEFFKGGIANLRRAGHLDYIPMPGAEACIKEPWRMAASFLYAAYGDKFLKTGIKKIDRKKWKILKSMLDRKINSPLTSSAGRLFDAVASIVLGKDKAGFEAELPIELEEIADKNVRDGYGAVNSIEMVKKVARDMKNGMRPSLISAKFHNSMAQLILAAAKMSKLKNVVLTGGVFQNRYLTNRAVELLGRNGFKVYTHSRIGTNDSGIPIGQIAIANARSSCA